MEGDEGNQKTQQKGISDETLDTVNKCRGTTPPKNLQLLGVVPILARPLQEAGFDIKDNHRAETKRRTIEDKEHRANVIHELAYGFVITSYHMASSKIN